ncbi:DUF3089 domain-containing protein [Aldersonia kunmingensis]|uniref:DUF3089 domain-containing protein n=1 Tax=Aldersonia kunmingensis TaxID=408066 RepID=UPI001FE0EBF2|nr:DUF3089 domain-containing protein [Aldersonia kunmingensis]
MDSDPCDLPQDTTDLLTGKVTAPAPVKESDKPVDCYFVYGTVSNQVSLNADPVPSPEVQSIARVEAARFNRTCRVFAPAYRQVPVPGLPIVLAGFTEPLAVGYDDVLSAWNDYLAHENNGRGVIFIGHSQGTFMLRKLIREQIDPNPQLRNRLVGAFLMGGDVVTMRGSTVGGDFANIPVCSRRAEYSCVTAYSTNIRYPTLSLFGNSSLDLLGSQRFGLASGPQFQVACTDPAVLSGSDQPVGVTLPSAPYSFGFISVLVGYMLPPEAWPTSLSTWTTSRARGVGSCEDVNGYSQYHIRMINPQPINEIPLFDTHVIDVNFGLDRLVDIAAEQARSWQADTR